MQTHRNAARRDTQERVYRQQQDTAGLLTQVLEGVETHSVALGALEQTVLSFATTDAEKIKVLVAWLHTPAVVGFGQVRHAARQLRQRTGGPNGPYYQVVEERSRALQQRLGDILRQVDYEGSAENGVGQALAYFQARARQLGNQPPTSFLKAAERVALDQAESRTTLYKALLAGYVADHLKAGKLNLVDSFSYRAFESYLLDATTWHRDREQLLYQTSLTPLREAGPWLDALHSRLAQAFAHTFTQLNEGANSAVRHRSDGRPRFLTPANPVADGFVPRPLYPESRAVSLYEVLHTVNQQCQCTDQLAHWNPRHRQPLPAERVFFAGLMAYGCNLGLSRMAHAAKQVNLSTLENTINWHFSVENLRRANDVVIALTGKLPVSRLFQRQSTAVHTASDGQKYYVAVDSIYANYSYKYFGQEKGIVLYSFIDNRHRLFYSTTFSSSEREAPYVLDGLLHNDVVESTIHSTDTHSFTEVNFALTYLLGKRLLQNAIICWNCLYFNATALQCISRRAPGPSRSD